MKKSAKRSVENLTVDTIEARCVRLVDESGKARATMTTSQGADKNAMTVIALLDDHGNPRLELQVCGNETAIRMSDLKGKATISMASRDDSQGISFFNTENSSSIILSVANDTDRDPEGNRQAPRLELADYLTGRRWLAQDALK